MSEGSEGKKAGMLESIIELKEQDPFEPFEIVLTSGDRFLIDAGANLVEMSDRFFYAVRGSDEWAWIRFNQIAAVRGRIPKSKSRKRAS